MRTDKKLEPVSIFMGVWLILVVVLAIIHGFFLQQESIPEHGHNLFCSKIHISEIRPPELPTREAIIEPVEEVETIDFPDTPVETIRSYIYDICKDYPNVDPAMIEAIVWEESRYISNVTGGGGAWIGLMQIAPKWHHDRMARLGVTDLFDPYSNLLVGIDYISELIETYHDKALALMVYNGSSDAYSRFQSGQLTNYAAHILSNTQVLNNGGELHE